MCAADAPRERVERTVNRIAEVNMTSDRVGVDGSVESDERENVMSLCQRERQ